MSRIAQMLFLLLTVAILMPASSVSQSPSLIPAPQSCLVAEGNWQFGRSTQIFISADTLRPIAELVAERLRSLTNLPLEIGTGTCPPQAIALVINDSAKALGSEGYILRSSPGGVVITSAGIPGIFYGFQSFLQLLPPASAAFPYSVKAGGGKKLSTGATEWAVPCLMIRDKPRFSWRGMHLDVCRHFFPKEFVKKYIDLLATYKMNVFHWHLTDDQGWRIEIKKFPLLTQTGSKRRETMGDCTAYGGFYTRDEVKEIVEYARRRCITVVPEIEMPGHAMAALAAYPEYSCSGGPIAVATEWGVFNDVYCAGNDATFRFLEQVLDEVIGLFPGPFVHIGGDECPKIRWKNCVKCQERIRALKLKDEAELQSYFVRRIEKFLNAKGKRLIGWDEILEGGLAPNASVMSWRGTEGGVAAARSGHDVVMTPTSYCYFDYYQGVAGEPKSIGGFVPVDTVYSYEPVPPDLTPDEAKHIIGAQGNLWTEWIPTTDQAEYMALPRLCAMSEVVWSDRSQRNAPDFFRRLAVHYDRLTEAGYNFRIPTPTGVGGKKILFASAMVTPGSPVPGAKVVYTLDGTDPSAGSPVCDGPIRVRDDCVLKAVAILPNGRASNPVTTYYAIVDSQKNGILCRYFEGTFDSLPPFRYVPMTSSRWCYDIGLQEVPHRAENYALTFSGTLAIGESGSYKFTIGSDDGSKLMIDGTVVADDDGLHGMKTAEGSIRLTTGKHAIEVQYFQRGGGSGLEVVVEGPGLPRQPLPPRMLLRKAH